MNFISILIVLGMLQYLGSVQPAHRDEWFEQWSQFLMTKLGSSSMVYLFCVFLPCALLVFLLLMFGSWGWGIVELAVFVLVLMYSLGRGEYNGHLEEYVQAWEEGNYEKLPVCIQAIDEEYTPQLGEGVQQTHVSARESFVYIGFSRLFVVLFWFVLLGPAAALWYRLTLLFLAEHKLEVALKVRDIMEWPAARLYGFTFAVVGDFAQAIANWFSTVMNAGMTNRQVIHANALAALNLDMDWLDGKFCETNSLQAQSKIAKKETKAIKELMNRSLVFTVIGIAIYQIII